MERLEILLDCDGVLADFHKGAYSAHGQEWDNPKVWDFWHDWPMSDTKFWNKLRGRDFWANLEPYEWTLDLFHALKALGRVTVCTAPCDDNCCASGKHDWLDKNLGIRPKDCMIGKEKYLLAGPSKLLIDDSFTNCKKFVEHGGQAILFPQPWNDSTLSGWRDVVKMVEVITHFNLD